METTPEKTALWWTALPENQVECRLCPRNCHISEGKSGFCGVRENHHGKLYAMAYGRPAAVHADPIEKKPLYHFRPGSLTYSLGTFGCNLNCVFCQNWTLSRSWPDWLRYDRWTPAETVDRAIASDCSSLAFTYNEPTIWAEFLRDTVKEARRAGLETVLVTNGYISPEALPEVYADISAANIDLKAFSDDFYRKHLGGRLQPVLDSLTWLRKNTDVWLEITCLLVPGLNDSLEEITRMAAWIVDTLGEDTPLHFSAFYPNYRLTDREATPSSLLHMASQIGSQQGLNFVYEGNIVGAGMHTYCPSCKKVLLHRSGHRVVKNELRGDRCPCGRQIPGRFDDRLRRRKED